jgi:hypothetical protein
VPTADVDTQVGDTIDKKITIGLAALPGRLSRSLPGVLSGPLAPALSYLFARGTGVLVLRWMTGQDHASVTQVLTGWDGQWYLGIAAGGYHGVPAGLADAFGHRGPDTALAFFPGYPWLIRWLALLPGVGGVSAAVTVSLAAGVFGAYALVRIGERVPGGSRRAGLALVVLFAAAPMAITLSMAYSEATFCALAAWALVGVLERRWLLTGVATAGAGLVRSTAAALVVVVLIAAVIAITRRRDGWRPWVGGLLAPAGLLGYLGYVAGRTGSPTGWFDVQRQGWNSGIDGGLATVRFTVQVLSTGRSVLEVGTVAMLVAALALVVVAIRLRLPWPLIGYGALVLALDLGSNGLMSSKARLLLPAFTLLVPVALRLAARRRTTLLVVLGAAILAGGWFGAYAITGWQYAI